MLPELLRVLNWSAIGGDLPSSMMESTITVIPKEGKDSLNPASYRPISLLNSDTKILAKVLAARLNKVIQKLVHQDHKHKYKMGIPEPPVPNGRGEKKGLSFS